MDIDHLELHKHCPCRTVVVGNPQGHRGGREPSGCKGGVVIPALNIIHYNSIYGCPNDIESPNERCCLSPENVGSILGPRVTDSDWRDDGYDGTGPLVSASDKPKSLLSKRSTPSIKEQCLANSWEGYPSLRPEWSGKSIRSIIHHGIGKPIDMAVCQNLGPLVNIKIAGKWMFIPLKMVLIGIDPYPYWEKLQHVLPTW